jgi:DNA-binding CsgD family transcriptional regulator
MGLLSGNEVRTLSRAIERLYAITSVAEFPAGVLSSVRKLLSCNTICFNEMAGPSSMVAWVTEPANALPGPLLREAFVRNFPQHPVLMHYASTGDGTSYRISDFIPRHAFHNLPLYSEYYRPARVEYQLIAAMFIGNHQTGIALDRDCRDFSDEERLSLELIRPHLAQAYRNVQTLDLMRHLAEDKNRRLLIVSRSGQTRLVSDDVWRTLDRYFDVPGSHDSLPDALLSWIRRERSRFGEDRNPPPPSAPLVVSKGIQRLVVRFVWGGNAGDSDTLVLEEDRSQSAVTLEGANLTPRESEILAWLAEGKTNAEIGLVLSISPRTVKKHLEHIYSKMQVHRRAAAVGHSYR